jgi:hypothetical protein
VLIPEQVGRDYIASGTFKLDRPRRKGDPPRVYRSRTADVIRLARQGEQERLPLPPPSLSAPAPEPAQPLPPIDHPIFPYHLDHHVVAERLGHADPEFVEELVACGELKVIQFGGRILIPLPELLAWAERWTRR